MHEPSYEELRSDLEQTRQALESRERRLRELGVTEHEPSYEELRDDLEETRQALESRERRLRELGVTDWESQPVKQEKVVIPTCHHIKENGRRCGSAAVSDRDYCHFHLSIRGRRLKMARARARGERYCVELPPLEDLYSVQV